jgi:molybdopterin converting factor small subunit
MSIRVEFFGIARQRAGVAELSLALQQPEVALAEILSALAARLPELADDWIADGRLHESLTANLDGLRFVSDPATVVRDGQSLLILSADAGG